jgi:hypothetical protein
MPQFLDKICYLYLNYTILPLIFQEKNRKNMKNFASLQILQGYLSSIDAVQKHVDDLRTLYQQIENDYQDIEDAEAANDQIAYSNAISNLEIHRQQLIGKFWELGVDAIVYYKSLSGNTQPITI